MSASVCCWPPPTTSARIVVFRPIPPTLPSASRVPSADDSSNENSSNFSEELPQLSTRIRTGCTSRPAADVGARSRPLYLEPSWGQVEDILYARDVVREAEADDERERRVGMMTTRHGAVDRVRYTMLAQQAAHVGQLLLRHDDVRAAGVGEFHADLPSRDDFKHGSLPARAASRPTAARRRRRRRGSRR